MQKLNVSTEIYRQYIDDVEKDPAFLESMFGTWIRWSDAKGIIVNRAFSDKSGNRMYEIRFEKDEDATTFILKYL